MPLLGNAEEKGLHVATNTYPWSTFANRESVKLELHTDRLLADIAGCGIQGYEPIIGKPSEFDGLRQKLDRHGLEMRSLYVNSVLHDETMADESIAGVLAIAEAAVREVGLKIIVTNPSPIRWGGLEDKSDDQLRTQAGALDRLGRDLRAMGVALAYHNHDAELREGGREFHHMLAGTDPENVKFCLDAHWIFRGCGDSEVAVFDAIRNYGDRIVELHLRQSDGGVWTETFSPSGDIDYGTVFGMLGDKLGGIHLVLEQAVEAQTPSTMSAEEAHSVSRRELSEAI